MLFLGCSFSASAQSVSGKVTDSDGIPLMGANILWFGTTEGTGTNEDGEFVLSVDGISDKRLIVSYIGYLPDTIAVEGRQQLTIQLSQSHILNTVEIREDRPGYFISAINPVKTEVITQKELTKAACCDLAGCFNTQGSVQPTTTNIITNTSELRILGLSGVYNQILVDGMPLVQGLSYTYGVTSIPGTLIDNIYISKGANSVLQGFESISGQINVELKEPKASERFLANAFINSFLEKQFNANFAHSWNKWHTLIAAHVTQPANKHDQDGDRFLDLPLLRRYSLFNKWQYGDQNAWGWHSMIGLRFVHEERTGGQLDFNPDNTQQGLSIYGQTVKFSQPEIYIKTGFRMDDRHHFVGFASAFHHEQLSRFGTLKLDASQLQTYGNFQYEMSWSNDHILKTGISIRYVDLDERIAFDSDSLDRSYAGTYLKDEAIPGVFAENIFRWNNRRMTLIAGLRADHHNMFGWFITPRALFKYNVAENTVVRISAGTGWRTVNLFSENVNLLASSRDIIITEEPEPEEALNFGINFTQILNGENVDMQISCDYYRTAFSNQIFPDYDTEPTKAFIGNFKGTSISNSFQAELGFEFINRIGTKVVYNYLDVYRIVSEEKYELPFNSNHRITGTVSYHPANNNWQVDMNLHWYGDQRLPNTTSNPEDYQLPESSDPYAVVNTQLTWNLKRFEIYGGCENIFDFRQELPILSWQDPFGPYFDSSSVWGPTRGREFYLGVRYRIE
jgi:outer membrane receptor for ferrienterochelin and colicin